MFDVLVEQIHKYKLITDIEADGAKPQYATFISREVKLNLSSFRDMNFQETRVDKFLGKFIIPLFKHYKHLWCICIIIFCITYGQAAIQWEFNVNKERHVDRELTGELIDSKTHCL